MKYLLGFIGIVLIIVLVILIFMGLLSVIGLAFKYISIPVAFLMSALLIHALITKKYNKKRILVFGMVIPLCIIFYFVSSPILEYTNSFWEGSQVDSDTNQEILVENEEDQTNAKITITEKSNMAYENELENEEEVSEEDNERWTKENTVEKLSELNVFKNTVKVTNMGFGSQVREHDSNEDGKTNMENPCTLELSLIGIKNSTISDIEVMQEIVFDIVTEIHNNIDKFDYNLCLLGIHFSNTDNSYGLLGQNFYIGINTIDSYFHEPRAEKVAISTVDGSIREIDFDSASFYKWIEDNFTQPEDLSVLSEDTSWTTTSAKSKVFP